MRISELKELVANKGKAVSDEALALLDTARHIEFGIADWVFRDKIKRLRQDYDALHRKFRDYDDYVWSYLGMASRPAGTNIIDDEGSEIKRFDPEIHGALSIYANYLFSQRENIRTTLRDIAEQANSLEASVNTNLTIGLAALSLLVALVSLIISVVALSK